MQEDRFEEGLIHNEAEMLRLVLDKGILTLIGKSFSKNAIDGFSVEDYTPRDLWYTDDLPGPWQWKDAVIRTGEAAYGKFVERKAAFVSMDLYPDFLNYRRSGFRFRPKRESKEKIVYETVDLCESLVPSEIRDACKIKRKSELDSILARLMMGGRITVKGFEHNYDHNMQPYGWGIGRYTTPEALYGTDALKCRRTPAQSGELILNHLREQLHGVSDTLLLKILG